MLFVQDIEQIALHAHAGILAKLGFLIFPQLGFKIIEAFGEAMDIPSKWLTVAIEEVEPDDWKADVVGPEIRAKEEFLYKEPEYLDD